MVALVVTSVAAGAQAPTGHLAVKKIVVNNVGPGAPIPAVFNTVTHCSQNAAYPGSNTPVAVPGNQQVTQTPVVVMGIICSVTETVPPPIAKLEACKGRGATWTVNYSPPVTIVTGQTAVLTVTNTLNCNAPTGGSLQVHKNVVNTLGVPTPATFNMVASCTGMAAAPLAVAPSQTVTVSNSIPGGTVCTITETLPPQVKGVKACPSGTASWVQSNPGPQTVHVAQTTGIIITNTLTCDKPTALGRLAVRKVVVNNTGDPSVVPPLFNTTTHCSASAGSPGVNTPVAVPGGQTVSQTTSVTAGFICSVTETLPPPIAKLEACKGRGATWTASYSPPVTIIAGQTVGLVVTNTLTCDRPTGGSLQVHKNVVNTMGVPTPATFNMVASCTGMAPASLTVAPGQTVTVSNSVPGGSVCTITETLPPQITGVRACRSGTASWIQTNPGPQTVHVAQTTGIIITNTLTCDTPTSKTGSLKVIKSVSNMTNGSVTMPTTYPMSVTCTPSGPTSQALAVPPGPAGATISNIAASSQCVVTEAALPPITNVKACNGGSASWTTMGSPSSSVTIPSGGTATVTIRNTLRCDPPSVSECPNPAQTVIGCRITVTVKRSKGPLIYSVTVSPTAPMPNVVAPSTPSSCVIGASAMINQTTCWFNYSVNPTTVTLTATSSAGALPAGFSWSGACSGSSPTCVLTASPIQKIVTANYP
ncbi:MAG: DUF5979 domain-containing protein [Gemmatimonadaceae bacterium]|nr:DUF5979 domain-containing protein [Gemmatimonadaceae bacterium]